MKNRKFINWLEKNKVKGDICPSLFDLTELWKLNSKRARGFNIYCAPFYLLFIVSTIPYTILCLVEALMPKETENEQ